MQPFSAVLPNTDTLNILIVDDNAGDIQLLTDLIWEVETTARVWPAQGAPQAFNHLAQSQRSPHVPRPDLIILDIRMPGRSGFEALSELKSDPRWRDLPVAMFSSSRLEIDERQAIAGGAVTYIVKPRDAEGFEEVAREVVALAKRLKGSSPSVSTSS